MAPLLPFSLNALLCFIPWRCQQKVHLLKPVRILPPESVRNHVYGRMVCGDCGTKKRLDDMR